MFEYLASMHGIEVRNFMKKKIKYSDLPPGGEPIGELKIIDDFLPRPEELIFKEGTDDGEDITIEINHRSFKFFKDQAKKHNTQYQKMISYLLEEYVARHNK